MEEEKKEKKSFLKTFLIILTTMILTSVIMAGSFVYYVYKANPFNVQACIITSVLLPTAQDDEGVEVTSDKTTLGSAEKTTIEKVDHPLLSDAQEESLKSAGVDVGALPTSITPEMEKCFTEKLGEKRVEEIKSGSALGPLDVLKGSSCL